MTVFSKQRRRGKKSELTHIVDAYGYPDDQPERSGKVPLLGDIPIIGQAFRKDSDTRSKTELYIVVTPHIVHRVGARPGLVPSNAPLYAPTMTTIIPPKP